jgi:hypothetical protein
MHLSLQEECRLWVEQALAALAGSAGPDQRLEMRLCAAQGALLVMARGAGAPDSGAAWTKALAIALKMSSTRCELSGLWLFRVNSAYLPWLSDPATQSAEEQLLRHVTGRNRPQGY